MDVEIRVESSDAQQELAALKRWLSAQRGLAGRVELVRGAPGAQELSGGAFELLTVAVGSGGTISVLAGALSSWLGKLREPPMVTVNGNSAPVPKGATVADIERLVRALKEGNGGA